MELQKSPLNGEEEEGWRSPLQPNDYWAFPSCCAVRTRKTCRVLLTSLFADQILPKNPWCAMPSPQSFCDRWETCPHSLSLSPSLLLALFHSFIWRCSLHVCVYYQCFYYCFIVIAAAQWIDGLLLSPSTICAVIFNRLWRLFNNYY